MAAWLGRQRKAELVNLAERAGLDDVEGLRKEELASVLDEYLQKNATRLAPEAAFHDYYSRGSPVKRNTAASAPTGNATSDGEVKVVKRRQSTKVKKEAEHDAAAASSPPGPSSGTIAVTPHAPRTHLAPHRQASTTLSTFPPSPAVVTDAIEIQTARLSAGVNDLITATNVETVLGEVREQLSSVISVELMVMCLESFYLQNRVVPWKYAFDTPAVRVLGLWSHAVKLPDLFILLTDVYWGSLGAWAVISFFIPLAASWLINLTMRPVARQHVTVIKPRWRCDPMTFNVVKALMAWIVYNQGHRLWGLLGDDTIYLVRISMPGGYAGVQIGAFVGILASLYDATQRK